jgi:hypothetical protein
MRDQRQIAIAHDGLHAAAHETVVPVAARPSTSPASTSAITFVSLGRNLLCDSAVKSGGAASTPDCAEASISARLLGALARAAGGLSASGGRDGAGAGEGASVGVCAALLRAKFAGRSIASAASAGASVASQPQRHANGIEPAVAVNLNREPGDEFGEHKATVMLSGSKGKCVCLLAQLALRYAANCAYWGI